MGQTKPGAGSQPVQVFCPACGFANLFWGKSAGGGEVIKHYGRRCQGWHKGERGARRCHHCQRILLDLDDMLKAALRL